MRRFTINVRHAFNRDVIVDTRHVTDNELLQTLNALAVQYGTASTYEVTVNWTLA